VTKEKKRIFVSLQEQKPVIAPEAPQQQEEIKVELIVDEAEADLRRCDFRVGKVKACGVHGDSKTRYVC